MTVIRRSALRFAFVLGLAFPSGCGAENSVSPPPPPAGSPPPPAAFDGKTKGGVVSNPSADSARGNPAPK